MSRTVVKNLCLVSLAISGIVHAVLLVGLLFSYVRDRVAESEATPVQVLQMTLELDGRRVSVAQFSAVSKSNPAEKPKEKPMTEPDVPKEPKPAERLKPKPAEKPKVKPATKLRTPPDKATLTNDTPKKEPPVRGSGRMAHRPPKSGKQPAAKPSSNAVPAAKPRVVGMDGQTDRPVPRIVYNPAPYPRQPYSRGLQGTTWLDVDVTEIGTAADVRLASSSGHRILDAAAQRAVWSWRFKPAVRNGKPVPMTVRVYVRFRI